MADAGIVAELGEVKRRLVGLEDGRDADRDTWRDYLARERRETCPTPQAIAKAIELSEGRTDLKIAKMEGKLNGSLVQNWILMGGVCLALLKIFGVITL